MFEVQKNGQAMSDGRQMIKTLPQISFEVLGKPQPAGSKKGFPIRRKNGGIGVVITDANANAKPWKATVASAAREAYSGPILTGPLSFCVTFYIVRPKSHFGTGRNKNKLKASAPVYPATKPDVLKLARAVEDALTGVIWRDDSQIVTELMFKCYGEYARASILIVQNVTKEQIA